MVWKLIWPPWNGGSTRAIKKIETACAELAKEDEETATTLLMDKLAEEIMENSEKAKKEIKKHGGFSSHVNRFDS